MRIQELRKITKLYFGYQEIARMLDITGPSARVLASRYAEQGFLVRLKRNVYILSERWKTMSREDLFELGNILQVPSYISLMTALEFYGVTTQVQRGVVESLSLKRTVEYDVEGKLFLYTRISKKLYGGFSRNKGVFIASPEKAFLDAVYLRSLSRYRFDITSIDLSKLDKNLVEELARIYPAGVLKMIGELWKS